MRISRFVPLPDVFLQYLKRCRRRPDRKKKNGGGGMGKSKNANDRRHFYGGAIGAVFYSGVSGVAEPDEFYPGLGGVRPAGGMEYFSVCKKSNSPGDQSKLSKLRSAATADSIALYVMGARCYGGLMAVNRTNIQVVSR